MGVGQGDVGVRVGFSSRRGLRTTPFMVLMEPLKFPSAM